MLYLTRLYYNRGWLFSISSIFCQFRTLALLQISAGIMQCSGIGPASYVVNSSDLSAVCVNTRITPTLSYHGRLQNFLQGGPGGTVGPRHQMRRGRAKGTESRCHGTKKVEFGEGAVTYRQLSINQAVKFHISANLLLLL